MTKEKKEPLRMCCACRKMKSKSDLIRIVKLQNEAGTIIEIDKTFKKQGRGAYMCKDEECLKIAIKKKALNRSLHCNVPDDVYECIEEELKANE